ncbi:MAG: hypothetical protein N2510_00400, partial [Ignavibacteria bacterium]|nr:hypothetical protein [Ignavibacteria bacterium]
MITLILNDLTNGVALEDTIIYSASNNSYDNPSAILMEDNLSFYVVGSSKPVYGHYSTKVFKYNGSGGLIWESTFPYT